MDSTTPDPTPTQPTPPVSPKPSVQPDPSLAIKKLFEKRPGQPLIAGHALFRVTEPAVAKEAETPAAQVPIRRSTVSFTNRLGRLVRPLASFGRSRSKTIVGLDIGTSSMKLIRVERTGPTPKIVGMAYEEYPLRAEGQVQEECVRTWLREQKRQGLLDGQLVIGCTNSRVIAELVIMPKMPVADLGRAVLWEAKERLSAEPATYSIRHIIVGESVVENQPKYDVLILVAPREELITQWRGFSEQGFKVLAIEPGILAALAACDAAGLWRTQEFIGLLDIGRRHSTLALIMQGAARFLRSFPVAGDSTTQSIMDYCQLDYEAAESHKREIGLSQMALEEDRRATGLEDEPRVRVSHALGLYLERLAAEVEHSLRYFTYELGYAKDRQLDALYICGGGARLKNLPPFLASRVNARVEVANPIDRWPMPDALKQRMQEQNLNAALITSLGLALHPPAK